MLRETWAADTILQLFPRIPMLTTAILIAGLAVIVAGAVAAWSWHAVAQVNQRLRSFEGFEGMHFES